MSSEENESHRGHLPEEWYCTALWPYLRLHVTWTDRLLLSPFHREGDRQGNHRTVPAGKDNPPHPFCCGRHSRQEGKESCSGSRFQGKRAPDNKGRRWLSAGTADSVLLADRYRHPRKRGGPLRSWKARTVHFSGRQSPFPGLLLHRCKQEERDLH